MNVLQISKWYLPYKGGIETVVHQIVEGLRSEQGRNFRVLSCNHEPTLVKRSGQVDGVAVDRVPSLGAILSTPVAPTFPLAYARRVRDADVVHVHTPFPLVELIDPWLSHNARLVVTLHSVPTQTKWTALDPLYQALLSRFMANAHRIVTTSEAMVDAVPFLQQHRDRCRVIPPAADVEQRDVGAEEREQLRRNLKLKGECTILFVGRLVYYKGVDVLLRALCHVENAVLVIVGKGPEREALQQLAAVLGIGDRVRFEGFVPDQMLPTYYSIADVFALPSVSSSEAFGIVQVEAMMYGTPVINTSLATGVSSVSRDKETGLTVPPENVTALAEAIRTLVSDEALRSKYGTAARERARDFEKTQVVRQYDDLYDAVLEERPVRKR